MSDTPTMTSLDSIAAIYTQADQGAYCEIKNPVTGDPIGLRVLVCGYEGERMKAHARTTANARMRNSARARPTVEMIEEQTTKTITHTVLGWEWAPGVTLSGEQPEASPEGIAKVFRILPFVPLQIDVFASDLSNYANALEAEKKAA